MAAALLAAVAPATAGLRLETLRFFDPNPEPSPVVGYRLHVGPDADHTATIDIGKPAAGSSGVRSYPLLIERGANVYVALTAYDGAGRESPRSNAILRAPRRPAFDHDADGASDLLRIDDASGNVEILRRGSGADPQLLFLGGSKNSSIVARGDFDGSGTSDLLWQRKGARTLTLWLLGAGGSITSQKLPTPGPRLRLLGVGDLDGDGRDDLVYEDLGSAELELWLMGEAGGLQQETIEGAPKPWRLLGIGDVEADRRSDLVWWEPSSGAVRIWHMNGAAVLEDELLPGALPKRAKPLGLGDLDADGAADLVLRLPTPQWIAFSPLRTGLGPLSVVAGVPVQIAAAAGSDFDADGLGDLALVDRSRRTLGPLLLGPRVGALPPADFAAASMPDDLAREIGDSDNDWQPDACDADLDNDGVVGSNDLGLLLACFGELAVDDCAALDADGDGTIGDVELASLASRFGEPPCEELAAP